MYTSGTALLIKLHHCFVSITAKNLRFKKTLRNFYYDNYKTRLSITKYLALRNKHRIRKKVSMKPFQPQKEF